MRSRAHYPETLLLQNHEQAHNILLSYTDIYSNQNQSGKITFYGYKLQTTRALLRTHNSSTGPCGVGVVERIWLDCNFGHAQDNRKIYDVGPCVCPQYDHVSNVTCQALPLVCSTITDIKNYSETC